jgi:hypothetical protein
MVKWLARKTVEPIHLQAGDTLAVIYSGTPRSEQLEHTMEGCVSVDTLAIGEIQDELGFKNGLVGVFGQS